MAAIFPSEDSRVVTYIGTNAFGVLKLCLLNSLVARNYMQQVRHRFVLVATVSKLSKQRHWRKEFQDCLR